MPDWLRLWNVDDKPNRYFYNLVDENVLYNRLRISSMDSMEHYVMEYAMTLVLKESRGNCLKVWRANTSSSTGLKTTAGETGLFDDTNTQHAFCETLPWNNPPLSQRPDGVFVVKMVENETQRWGSARTCLLITFEGDEQGKINWNYHKVIHKMWQGIEFARNVQSDPNIPCCTVRANWHMDWSTQKAQKNGTFSPDEAIKWIVEICKLSMKCILDYLRHIKWKFGNANEVNRLVDVKNGEVWDYHFFIGSFRLKRAYKSETKVATSQTFSMKRKDSNKQGDAVFNNIFQREVVVPYMIDFNILETNATQTYQYIAIQRTNPGLDDSPAPIGGTLAEMRGLPYFTDLRHWLIQRDFVKWEAIFKKKLEYTIKSTTVGIAKPKSIETMDVASYSSYVTFFTTGKPVDASYKIGEKDLIWCAMTHHVTQMIWDAAVDFETMTKPAYESNVWEFPNHIPSQTDISASMKKLRLHMQENNAANATRHHQAKLIDDMHFIDSSVKKMSLSRTCCESLYKTLPELDRDLQEFITQKGVPSFALIMRTVRCLDLWAFRSLSTKLLQHETLRTHSDDKKEARSSTSAPTNELHAFYNILGGFPVSVQTQVKATMTAYAVTSPFIVSKQPEQYWTPFKWISVVRNFWIRCRQTDSYEDVYNESTETMEKMERLWNDAQSLDTSAFKKWKIEPEAKDSTSVSDPATLSAMNERYEATKTELLTYARTLNPNNIPRIENALKVILSRDVFSAGQDDPVDVNLDVLVISSFIYLFMDKAVQPEHVVEIWVDTSKMLKSQLREYMTTSFDPSNFPPSHIEHNVSRSIYPKIYAMIQLLAGH